MLVLPEDGHRQEPVQFEPMQTLVQGVLNAAVALPLYRILDRLKVTE